MHQQSHCLKLWHKKPTLWMLSNVIKNLITSAECYQNLAHYLLPKPYTLQIKVMVFPPFHCAFLLARLGKIFLLTYLPRHWVSVPLQSPFTKHSLTWEPTRVYPVLQVKIAVAPYTVKVPILLPLGGDGRLPQEITEKGRYNAYNIATTRQAERQRSLTETNTNWHRLFCVKTKFTHYS